MKNRFVTLTVFLLLIVAAANASFAQDVLLGPRLTGNFNIFNEKGLTGSYNGIGIGIGGTVDVSFNKHIGIMANLTFFDMKGFSNSTTTNNQTTDASYSLSYITLDPMFKLDFSGFYIVAGPSLGIKLNSSGDVTQTTTGQPPVVNPSNLDTKSVIFNIAFGTGYTFTLSQNSMYMGTDFMVYIPITDTYNFPGTSNSVLTLKLGVSLKFKLI
jgi:Outer membrane protein beta-barrel domain